jgi:hypothetical protein
VTRTRQEIIHEGRYIVKAARSYTAQFLKLVLG